MKQLLLAVALVGPYLVFQSPNENFPYIVATSTENRGIPTVTEDQAKDLAEALNEAHKRRTGLHDPKCEEQEGCMMFKEGCGCRGAPVSTDPHKNVFTGQ